MVVQLDQVQWTKYSISTHLWEDKKLEYLSIAFYEWKIFYLSEVHYTCLHSGSWVPSCFTCQNFTPDIPPKLRSSMGLAGLRSPDLTAHGRPSVHRTARSAQGDKCFEAREVCGRGSIGDKHVSVLLPCSSETPIEHIRTVRNAQTYDFVYGTESGSHTPA